RFCPSDQYTSRHCCAPLSLEGSYPMRSHVESDVPGSIHCCVYRPTKRPSHCGEVAIQYSIGARYRLADTVCGALGFVLTSRKSLQLAENASRAAQAPMRMVFIIRTTP